MLRFSPNPNHARLIHWSEWEEPAFRKARDENKPVMLFLSAFWCRYCQRMDEDALSDKENRALLNAYFSPLRVENATRPDIDARYNLNGWPTLAFFSPGGDLLAASNYLPAEEFKNVLLNVYLAYQRSTPGEARAAAPEEIGEDTAGAAPGATERLQKLTQAILAQADREHGGFGSGQKFIHPAANGLLLALFEATGQAEYRTEACRTLDRMVEGQIHDPVEGGFFRTASGADWSQPHREKLLHEHAGLLTNYLDAFRLTGRARYRETAEEIIAYLDRRLFEPRRGAFLGCEDFLRCDEDSRADEFFTILDECVYSDANAQAACAYFAAARLLGRADCRARAFAVLEFLWRDCRTEEEGVFHFHDGAPRLPGLLEDQAQLGTALIEAYHASGGEPLYLDRARRCADFIVKYLKNPAGGYRDCAGAIIGLRKAALTDLDQNGMTASFFLRLSRVAGEERYRAAGRWGLAARSRDEAAGGIHAARLGRALLEYLSH